MTETMIERGALAIYEKRNRRFVRPEWVDVPIEFRAPYYDAARAVIEAMRERTDAMIAAISDRDGDAFDADWRSSIDAALSETEGG